MKVMKGVARGLHTLHGADIVHGSLHENNVFAVNRQLGIVGDFDFTKSEVVEQKKFVGKKQYFDVGQSFSGHEFLCC